MYIVSRTLVWKDDIFKRSSFSKLHFFYNELVIYANISCIIIDNKYCLNYIFHILLYLET